WQPGSKSFAFMRLFPASPTTKADLEFDTFDVKNNTIHPVVQHVASWASPSITYIDSDHLVAVSPRMDGKLSAELVRTDSTGPRVLVESADHIYPEYIGKHVTIVWGDGDGLTRHDHLMWMDSDEQNVHEVVDNFQLVEPPRTAGSDAMVYQALKAKSASI